VIKKNKLIIGFLSLDKNAMNSGFKDFSEGEMHGTQLQCKT